MEIQEFSSVGLMPGSYNPAHAGHLDTACKLKEKFNLKSVWFAPIPVSSMKKGTPQATFAQKVHMCEIIAKPHSSWLSVYTGFEDFPSGKLEQFQTIKRTLEQLRANSPSTEFSIVSGHDFYKKLQWAMYMLHIAAMIGQATKNSLHLNFEAINHTVSSLSNADTVFQTTPVFAAPRSSIACSSQIRRSLLNGDENIAGLPSELYQFIRNEKIYEF